MRKEYQDELEQLRSRMEKAEQFARKLPVLAEKILSHKFTGEEDWINFGEYYKKIPLQWGITRGLFSNNSNRTITNYPKNKDYSRQLFWIYINSISLFDVHNLFDLHDYLKDVDIFFNDGMNTTFYITDENIEAFLEALNTWYCDAMEKLKLHRLQKQEAELKKKLEETQNQLKQTAA